MKGIPELFNDIIRNQLKVYAAWLPITNTLKLGDYGLISGGIFEAIGNIKDDFGISFTEAPGPEADIDFTSSSTRVIKVAGGVEVDVIPAGSVDARVSFKFDKEKSFLIKSPSIQVTTIPNPNAIAKKLMDHPEWDGKFKVVHKVYHAKEAIVISTIDAGTEISLTGDVSALRNMKIGSASLNIDTNKSLGLKIHGKEGVIGLALFRIKNGIFGGKKIDLMRGVKKKTNIKDLVEIFDGVELEDDL